MPGFTKKARKAKNSMTKKNNIDDSKKKKKKKLPIGLRLPEGFKNIIDHGPEFA